jgi:CBS domain-containing protein
METREIMSSPAITVTSETPIRDLARLMLEKQISGVPVVNQDGELVGIVTELDLITRNAPLHQPSYLAALSGLIPANLQQYRQYRQQLRQVLAASVEELMSPASSVASPTSNLEELMVAMSHPEITLLPVVENGQVVGVVTRTDLVRQIERLEMAPELETGK